MTTHQTIGARTGGPGFSRRGFLGASGGLVVAFAFFGTNVADAAAGLPAGAAGGDLAPPPADKLYAWLAVNPDNTATLFTGKVETGTGVGTALAQIAAEELDFPLDRLDVVMGTTSQTVDQGPSYGSRTIRYAGPQIRQAAAAGRLVLLRLAAAHFNAPVDQLVTGSGTISLTGSAGKRITYGALVAGKRLDYEIGASGTQFDMRVAADVRPRTPRTTPSSATRFRARTSPAR